MFGQPFNIDSQSFVLPDFETVLRSFAGGHEQILNFLIIDFKHRQGDLKLLFAWFLILPNFMKNLLADHGDDASIGSVSDHGVRFSCSSLPIGEEAAVIAIPK